MSFISDLFGGDAPDTSRSDKVAADSLALGNKAFDWFTGVYNAGEKDRKFASDTARTASALTLDAARTNLATAAKDRQFYDTTVRPMQTALVNDAATFNTEAKREELAGLALGDVNTQFGNARDQTTRQLTRMGVNPSDGATGATLAGITTQQALAGADAKNKARFNAISLGDAKKVNAINAVNGVPAQATQSTQLGLSSVGSAVNTAGVPAATRTQGAAVMDTGFNRMQQGLSTAGNIYQGNERVQAQANDSTGLWNAIGNVGGAYAGSAGGSAALTSFFSDRRLKTDIRKLRDDPRGFGWYEFRYKAGGGLQTGVMADEVRGVIPEAVGERDGYLTVDYSQL